MLVLDFTELQCCPLNSNLFFFSADSFEVCYSSFCIVETETLFGVLFVLHGFETTRFELRRVDYGCFSGLVKPFVTKRMTFVLMVWPSLYATGVPFPFGIRGKLNPHLWQLPRLCACVKTNSSLQWKHSIETVSPLVAPMIEILFGNGFLVLCMPRRNLLTVLCLKVRTVVLA